MDRKKNAVVREYRKFQKKKGSYTRNQEDQSHGNEHEEEKLPFFRRALQEYEAKKKQKEREMQLRHAKRKEREEALRKYTEKKRQNFKKLSQKTKWGQPVMSGRIEILLEKIQKSVNSEK